MRPEAAETIPFIRVLGVRVHMVQIPEVVTLMEQWIGAGGAKCRQIVVTGMHGITVAHEDQNFKAILNAADLFIPDGISLIWIARSRGFRLRKRACGSDLMREYCRSAAQKGHKNFFYGDTEDTLRLLMSSVQREFPGLKVVGTFSPPFRPLTPEEDDDVVRMINQAKPDVLWVGLGCPKQERWIFEHRERLKVPVAIGVGAAFKFLSGKLKRAPAWVGDHGLEWFWRFLNEPRREWQRVLVDAPQFVFHVVLELSGLGKYD